MASKFTRKWLEAMGIDAEKIDVLVEAHSDAMKAVIEERDGYKAELDKLDTSKDWKAMYEAEHKKVSDLETANQQRETRAAKEAALREVYKDAGIAEKYFGSLLRIADYNSVEVGADGKAANHKELVEAAKKENADFIPVQTVENGQNTPKPPASGGKTHMTRDEIMAIKDERSRRSAIAENLDVFGY